MREKFGKITGSLLRDFTESLPVPTIWAFDPPAIVKIDLSPALF
jgi:hypothetical protein